MMQNNWVSCISMKSPIDRSKPPPPFRFEVEDVRAYWELSLSPATGFLLLSNVTSFLTSSLMVVCFIVLEDEGPFPAPAPLSLFRIALNSSKDKTLGSSILELTIVTNHLRLRQTIPCSLNLQFEIFRWRRQQQQRAEHRSRYIVGATAKIWYIVHICVW